MSAATSTQLPSGTVTFLRTDVEGSMRHARELGSGWDELNERQLALIRDAVAANGGAVVRTEGDAVFAAFADAGSALSAALALQEAVGQYPWPPDEPVRVRVGLHAGEAHLAGDDYGGFEVNRAARIAAVGHGGQIIASDPVRALVSDRLPPGVTFRDLGRHPLRDVPQPERLLQVDAPGLPTDFPPPRTAARVAGNLPARLTSFVGREREVDELDALLAGNRLVSIVGPGGIGKTSLAIEVARRCATRTPDGAWFVPLDSTDDPALVGATIARTLGLYDGPGRAPIEGAARFLADRDALLVLDNFEHLLDAAADVPTLLRAAPGLRVLVTSRASLRVGGEQEYALAPLGDGGADAAAVRLFEERARSVAPGWSAPGDGVLVEEVCRLLDGLPLGIELAAARAGRLPLRVIRDRLAARLPLPGAGPRDLPTRQRTLDNAIAWSYDQLMPERQRLVRQLATFDGGFDLEQAAAVAAWVGEGDDVLEAVIELADQSLVEHDTVTPTAPATGGLRFRMLETIRAFALRALEASGEAQDTRLRHAEAFAALAEEATGHMPGGDQVRWLDRLHEDHANLRAAIDWAIEAGRTRLAQRLSAALWRYWQISGQLREGRAFTDAVVAMPGADEPSTELLWSLAAAGGMAYWQGESDTADALYRRQLEVAEQIGDRAGEADACWNLAATDWIRRDVVSAGELIERARTLYEAIGDEMGAARTEWGRCNLLIEEGRLEEATALNLAALERYEELGDAYYGALATGDLAWIYALKGDVVAALGWALESLRRYHAMRDVATTILTLAPIALVGGQQVISPGDAAILYAAFEHFCEVHGVRPPTGLERMIAVAEPELRLRSSLTTSEHAKAQERGRHMNIDDAVAYALEVGEAAIRDAPPSPRTG